MTTYTGACLTVLRGGERSVLFSGELNTGFSELTEVTFTVLAEVDCDLLIDDERLHRSTSDGAHSWTWRPGFYAGEVRADLVAGDVQLGSWRLDVSPAADKLGRDTFHYMVSELLAFDEKLVLGQEPARRRMGVLGPDEEPLVALARLRANEPAIWASLAAVVREPIRALRPRRRLVPIQAVRRADRRTALAALREPALLGVIADLDAGDLEIPRGGLWVDVPEVERHLDCAANRCMLAVVQALTRRWADIRARLEKMVASERESATVTGLAARWDVRRRFLDDTRARLRRIAQLTPFDEVTRAEVTAAGLNAVSAHPLYARAYRSAWQALRRGMKGEDRHDLLPLSPTWEIYERWCYVRLLERLRAWVPGLEWVEVKHEAWSATKCWEGTGSDGTIFRLLLQPRFRSTDGQPASDFWSVTGLRYPDIVLWRRQDGIEDFVVLDAKYRSGREGVLAGMGESAHLYQDSLRHGDRRPALSLLLLPSTKQVPWLEDRQFVQTHRVGVATLSPEAPSPSWLREVLLGGGAGAFPANERQPENTT